MLLQIHYLCCFCRQCFVHKLTGLMYAVGHYTWPASSCKMFKHFMICVKIILCLKSHGTIIELSAPPPHSHYVNNIIYIYIYIWWELGEILTYLKCELHKFCRIECSHTSWSICFVHVYRWEIYILIILGDVLFKNDEKIWIKYQILYFYVCQHNVTQLSLWFNLYSKIECEFS